MGYKYYDTPLGQDVDKKLWISTKLAGGAGLIVSTGDVMLYSHPQGYLQTLGRYVYITGPFIAVAGAYTVTSNLLTTLRGKNDKINYFLGGVAAGTVVGAWRKSILTGVLMSISLGVMATVRKDFLDNNWVLAPPVNRQVSGVNARAFDFTLTKERPRNWTTGQD